MTRFDPKSLETAFLPPGTLSLADCLARIEQDEALSPVRRRDLASGLRRLAAALKTDPALLMADLGWLQPRLARVVPAALGLSPKTWANTLSNARAALEHCGITKQPFREIDDLSPLWGPLWDTVRASGDLSLRAGLGRLVRFLDNTGVAPGEVGAEHLDQFRQALVLNELRRSPEIGVRRAARAWNRAAERVAGWPAHVFALEDRRVRIALPLDVFPSSFAQDLRRYLDRLERPDLLDPTALAEPLRPASVAHRRAQVVRFASALVHAGVGSQEVRSLADLVNPGLAKRGLSWLLERQGGATSPGLADMAVMLKTLARHHVPCSPEDLKAIEDFARRLARPPQKGLSPKNRERLRPLEDEAQLQRLVTLPDRVFAQNQPRAGLSALVRREVALAIAILQACPIRRRNLVTLHLERNLRRLGDGRVVLVYEASEVKNRRTLEFELPVDVAGLIDEHLATRPPRLCPAATPWLFPRRDGTGPMDASRLSSRISACIRTETGLKVHPHLFRHLAARIWLRARPGHHEDLRRILGHSRLSSTLDVYAGFEAEAATKAYAAIVTAARRGPA